MLDRIAQRVSPAVLATGLIALAAALIVPQWLPSYWLSIAILAVVSAVLAIGLNLLMGFTGLDSLGQAAFFGSAAYFLGIATVRYGMSWWLAAAGGLVLATLIAALFGLIAVRLSGLYFLLITLALGQVLWGVVQRWGVFTGGSNGLSGVTRPLEQLRQPLVFYYVSLSVLVIAFVLSVLLVRSPFGLTLKGIREREIRSKSLGFNTRWHKYVAFVIAGFSAAVAGVLNATFNSFVSPRDLSVELSFDAMLMVIVGGTGTLAGPLVGGLIVTALRFLLSVYIESFWLLVLGAVFVGVTIWMPKGVVGLVASIRQTRKERARSESNLGREPEGTDAQAEAVQMQRLAIVAEETMVPDEAMRALHLSGVSKTFGDVRVLHDVDLAVRAGERVGMIGLNGAGKTTLFNVISGIHPLTEGRIEIFGEDLTTAAPHERSRSGLARTFQVTNLYPRLTAHQNVMLALLGRRFRRYQFVLWKDIDTIRELVSATDVILDALGLSPLRNIEVRFMSYGHQRQVEIALALASDPRLLLLDEPTAGLAQGEIPPMMEVLKGLPDDLTILIVEHNLEVIFEVVDRVVVLHEGSVIRDASPEEVRRDPEVRALYFGSGFAPSRSGENKAEPRRADA